MRVLVACEFSGIVRDAFARRGHDAWSCDLYHTERKGNHIQDYVERHLDEDWDLMIAHPPCTYLTCAGNKWFLPKYKSRFPNRAEQRELAVKFFLALTYTKIPKTAIENPIGIMSSRFRKPDQIIHPYEFGHPVMKATALWLKNLPPLQPTNLVEPELHRFASGNVQSRWHTETGHIADKAERARARSCTFAGIAEAMAEQWGQHQIAALPQEDR